MQLVERIRRYAPEAHFFLYNAAIVFLLPYLGILWREQGFTGSQIGILSAVRPFICSVSGQLLVGVADARRWHFAVTIATYIITLAARSSMALASGFVAHLILIAVSEACQSPFSIISDAAIAASTDEAGYGRKRVLASLGWGALAPLSGWIVGKWGVPRSIALYFAFVTAALVPTVLLPLRELGRRRSQTTEQEAEPASVPATKRSLSSKLARSSAGALLLPAEERGSDELDGRQHNGHAAELAIELLGVSQTSADAAAAEAVGHVMVERINSRLSRAGSLPAQAQLPDVRLPPLLTTADEDAAAEEAATARTAGTTPAGAAEDDSWSISAVGSPLTAQRRSLPPIACPHAAHPAGALPTPLHGPTPSGGISQPGLGGTPTSFGTAVAGGLARTTSAATTAFYSIRSESSLSGTPGMFSPRPGGEPGTGSIPRSALLAQLAEASSLAAPTAATPLIGSGGEPGSLGGSFGGSSLPQSVPHAVPPRALFRQTSDVATTAAGSASFIRSARLSQLAEGAQPGSAGWQPGMPPRHPLWRQPSDPASLAASTQYATPRGMAATPRDGQGPTPGLLRQASTISQAQDLTGFDLSAHDCTAAAAALSPHMQRQQQRFPLLGQLEQPLEQPPSLQPQVSCLSQALSGFEGSIAGGTNIKSAPLVPTSPRTALSITADCSSSAAKAPLSAVSIAVEGGEGGAATAAGAAAPAGAAGKRKDVSVMAGIAAMLRNPHHAAFFATALLMGVGYGALGYEQLYLKESGAPGILLGMGLLVGTCVGEAAVFASQGWWLPKLGMELAFNVGMAGWVVRLGLLTLLPLFPSLWLVLPVDLLQGVTFGVAYGTGMLRAKAIAPPHLRSTTTALFFALYYGVGPGISGLSGGIIYERMGMRCVFIIFSLVLLAGWILVLLALRWATRAERRRAAEVAELAP